MSRYRSIITADETTIAPDELSEDMRPSDLVFVLEHLPFSGCSSPTATCQLIIDRGVRDYLVRALTPKRPESAAPKPR
jgi:hypothetical protein